MRADQCPCPWYDWVFGFIIIVHYDNVMSLIVGGGLLRLPVPEFTCLASTTIPSPATRMPLFFTAHNKYKYISLTKIMSPSTHRIFIDDGNSSWKSRFAVADVLSAATSKLSSTASTPAGAFGAALAILCASAAALWMYGRVVEGRRSGYDGGGGDDDVDIKRSGKDPRVASLRRRFLAIFWLLRMADWLQVREKSERVNI